MPKTAQQVVAFARGVALEILDGMRGGSDSKKESTGGQEGVRELRVFVGSLEGESPDELYIWISFDEMVRRAKAPSRRSGGGYDFSPPILSGYHADLVVENGHYTGWVTVRE